MDVSYSVWREIAVEKLELGGESFSFLFDRRYTNRLNRMSRVFFEAYAKATLEVSAEEDRFPSLSEIESRMESGAIYAYKDRLTRSTGFFEEVKISGISYLIPKARRFVDETGTYTDLILDLEKGEVVLPKRDKTSAIARSGGAEPEEESTESGSTETELEDEEGDITVAREGPPSELAGVEKEQPLEPDALQTPPEEKAEVTRVEEAAAETKAEEPLFEKVGPPAEVDIETDQATRAIEAEAPKIGEPLERAPAEVQIGEKAPVEVEEEFEAPDEEILVETEEPEPEMYEAASEKSASGAEIEAMEKGAKATEPEQKPPALKRAAAPLKPQPSEKKPGKGFAGWRRDHKGPFLALAALVLVLILAAFYIWSPLNPETPATPAQPSDFVGYSAYLTNTTGNIYLNLDVTNPKGLESEVELVLPPDVDKSISATGGIVTISYTNNTVIRLVSSNNASVSVALTDEYVLVPVTFNLAIPQGYESSVLVYDKDYKVSRTNSTINLWCNCTDDHLEFDQIYNAKKVSGDPGPQERGPENVTDGP